MAVLLFSLFILFLHWLVEIEMASFTKRYSVTVNLQVCSFEKTETDADVSGGNEHCEPDNTHKIQLELGSTVFGQQSVDA
eukprot:m.287581 g.287581  ORF g.287581 m.287581 type:complete len:80 (-) comp15790_c5_seq3:3664-3903(-)